MSEHNEPTQTIWVDVVEIEGKLQMALIPGDGVPGKIVTVGIAAADNVMITQMLAKSTLKYQLTKACEANYEMMPITCVSNFGRQNVESALDLKNPPWNIETAGEFRKFIPKEVVHGNAVIFHCVDLPAEPGVEHSCQFTLNIVEKSKRHHVHVNQNAAENHGGEDDSHNCAKRLFVPQTLSHDPIIIVGKPK